MNHPNSPLRPSQASFSGPLRTRRQQRGVTVFVIMMAIMILTGAGTWAMYSAGLSDQASGYARASAQAMYTAELGLLAGSAYLSIPGYADANFQTAKAAQYTGNRDSCWSANVASSVTQKPFCKNISMANLDTSISTESLNFGGTAYTLLDQAGAQGSLGPFAQTDAAGIQADFFVEMTEPRPVTLPGESTSTGAYQRVTLTSYSIVRPSLGAGSVCTGSKANNAAATLMGMRAHMIIGPLTSQITN